MSALREFLEEYAYGVLTAIAVGLAVFLTGVGSIVVGAIWILWRFLDALNLPTMLLFRAAFWFFFWPGILIQSHAEKPDALVLVITSGLGWFVFLAVVLNAGRFTVRKLRP